jgi:hypothetical protein
MYELGNGEGFLVGYFAGGGCLVSNTPEQISAFIMAASDNCQEDVVISNIQGDAEITTFGWFINKCKNQGFLPKLVKVLAPQQSGDAELIEFIPFETKNIELDGTENDILRKANALAMELSARAAIFQDKDYAQWINVAQYCETVAEAQECNSRANEIKGILAKPSESLNAEEMQLLKTAAEEWDNLITW